MAVCCLVGNCSGMFIGVSTGVSRKVGLELGGRDGLSVHRREESRYSTMTCLVL